MATPSLTTGLNPAQQEAVDYLHGPCLVLAGAGSGKTRVITHKIARLIQAGCAPQQIAAITFTNKAAAEMRERARGLIGARAANAVTICTFHALGVRMLRQSGAALGLKPNFSILDASDVLSLLKDCGSTTDAAVARQWQWTISLWKNQGIMPEQALALAASGDEGQRSAAVIYGHYQERLQAYQSVDFDDLIGLPLTLLQQHPDVRSTWQQALQHILVDEYQDTNATQYELLRLLVGTQPRFTAVGDDDQSIYGWRGATLDNLKRLPQDYPDLHIIKLEQNYRSTSAILRAANHVITANPKLFAKTLWSELGEGEPVRIVDADNEEHEAERTVARIQSLRATSSHREFKDFAVLYRANHQSRPLEMALHKANIPYKVSGGTGFFDRAEIKDLCAWFRLLSNEDDDPAFVRAITSPKRGIGHTTLTQLGEFASHYRVSMFEALFSPLLDSALPRRAVDGLHEFGRYINDLQYNARHTSGAEAALAFLHEWLRDIQFEKYLYDSEDSEKIASARWSRVLEFCDWMASRCGGQMDDTAGVHTTNASKTVLEVAQNVALLSTISEREQDQNVVTLSTLHAAKGLEWPHVVLIGAVEGLLPFRSDSVDSSENSSTTELRHTGNASGQTDNTSPLTQRIQEERRLMYVGITRAQHTLAVSWPRQRKKGRDMVKTQPSRFIAEMALDAATAREDPREKLKALRAEFAQRAAANKLSRQL